MKKKLFFKSFLAAVMLTIGMSLSAQNTLTTFCPGYCNPTGAGGIAGTAGAFYMVANTEANGDITFSILGLPGNTSTSFRNYGWADGIIPLITVNTDPNTANKYFTRTISADKTKITLVKQSDIPAGATIDINGILEYQTNLLDGANMWPTIDFQFQYGSTCTFVQTPLAAPVISSIGTDKKITFSSVANAASYMVYVFRDADIVYSQAVTSGDVVNYTPTLTYNYTVKVKAITGSVNYMSSDYSTGYTWALTAGTVTIDPSIYCNYLIGSGTSSAYMTWQTDVNGNVVISLAGYAGDANTAFRGNGFGADLSKFMVNGNPASNYFTRTYTTGATTFTLTLKSGATIVPGDKISYTSGTVEWKTTGNTNAYSTYTFSNYVYGSNCSSLPTVSSTPANITFSPTTGTQTFTLTGTNLTGAVTITPPRGVNVAPSTITPAGDKTINQVVTASWTDGSGTSTGSIIQVSGGGLVSNVAVLVNTSGFSGYCNKVISQENGGTWAAYMSIAMSSDKTQMILTIAPYATGETATWNSIAHIVVNGGTADAMVASKVYSTDKTQCTVTFTSALSNGALVTFGNALVWTVVRTSSSNTNVYINALQGPYTVGQTCNLSGPTTALSAISEQELNVYPNPANDRITISGEVSQVNIYSVTGKLVHTSFNKNTVDVSTFAKGLYLVKVTDNVGNMKSTKLQVK